MRFNGALARAQLNVEGRSYDYFRLREAENGGLHGISRLPYTLKIILENQLRQQASGLADGSDVEAVARWIEQRRSDDAIGLRVVRVLTPDDSGMPLLGDMAAMRDAIARLSGDPRRLNPHVPVDFIVDHSVTIDEYAHAGALAVNMALESGRNKERFEFLRWSKSAFANLRIVPPGNGICHQINLEHVARVVWTSEEDGRVIAMPDSVIGVDSHTPMINSLGVLGIGVGGLEGAIAALGEPVSMLLPEVVGCRLTGKLQPGITATDIALTITQLMRRHKVGGKFVEYCGPGIDELALADRATISNMTAEFGATVGFFPVDAETLRFLTLTGREPHQVKLVEAYCKAQGLWRDAATPVPDYSDVVELDLGSIEPSVAGPHRPHDRVTLHGVPAAFSAAFPGKAVSSASVAAGRPLKGGDVVIAAITSCTNTSNPSVMIAAGLLARNAVARGLRVKAWVKTSLAPGSRVVADYLEAAGLMEPLEQLGYHVAGFGCTTCMGNSGPLPEAVAKTIAADKISTVAVLSGNRNFEGRVHPAVRANFIASPPLVIAYALAGSICVDLTRDPLGHDERGAPVYLRDIWPARTEIDAMIGKTVTTARFRRRYDNLSNAGWDASQHVPANYDWNPKSHFIRRPPFLDDMTKELPVVCDIRGARVLAMFGDMLTTDHISPIGAISAETPAGQYLRSLGVAEKDFVSYAARRLNHDVMIRGTFANVRIRNEMTPGVEGSWTRHEPSGEEMSIFVAARRYEAEGVPLVVIGGADYGAGSSRDWAAKGTKLLGVRAVIAESFERMHRSNLVGMGVLPLQFTKGETRHTLKLTGSEIFDITGLEGGFKRHMQVECTITRATGERLCLPLLVRIDTGREADYFSHGGIFHAIVRRSIA